MDGKYYEMTPSEMTPSDEFKNGLCYVIGPEGAKLVDLKLSRDGDLIAQIQPVDKKKVVYDLTLSQPRDLLPLEEIQVRLDHSLEDYTISIRLDCGEGVAEEWSVYFYFADPAEYDYASAPDLSAIPNEDEVEMSLKEACELIFNILKTSIGDETKERLCTWKIGCNRECFKFCRDSHSIPGLKISIETNRVKTIPSFLTDRGVKIEKEDVGFDVLQTATATLNTSLQSELLSGNTFAKHLTEIHFLNELNEVSEVATSDLTTYTLTPIPTPDWVAPAEVPSPSPRTPNPSPRPTSSSAAASSSGAAAVPPQADLPTLDREALIN